MNYIRVFGINKSVAICIIICLICPVKSFRAFSQIQKKWQWIEHIGSESWDITSGMTCDSKNYIYLAGNFSGTLFAGKCKIKSNGNQDSFVAKFKDDGSLSDIFNIGGKRNDKITCISSTPADNIIFGGLIADTVFFGRKKLTETGERLFICSLDNKGSFKWITPVYSEGEALLLFTETDKIGFICAAGIFKGTLTSGDKKIVSKGLNDVFLMRLNPAGIIEKLESFGSKGDDLLESLSVDLSGNITMSCSTGKPEDFFGQDIWRTPSGIKMASYIAKLDNSFKIIWINPFYSNEFLNISGVKSDNNGNIYAVGSFSSELILPDTVLKSGGYTDGFAVKLNDDGKTNWVKTAGTWYYDYFNHLNIDKNGGIVVSGSVGDTLIIDSLHIEPESVYNSAIILQFSSGGKAIWADHISGEKRSFSNGTLLDNKGNLYFTGNFKGKLQKGQKILDSYGDQDIFIGKYFNCPDKKANVYGNLNFCYGSFTELSVRKSYNNVVWNDSITGKYSIVIDKPGFVKVRMTDNKGCVLFDSLEVKRNELPSFSLGRDTTVDRKDSLLLKAPQNFVSYTWQDLSSDRFYVAKAVDGKAGTYDFWLTVTDSLKCSYADSIKITFLENYNPTGIPPGKLVVYPNPASDILVWSLFTEKPLNLIAELTDDQGKKYYRQLIDRYFPGEEKEISIRNLKPGIYNLSLINKDYLSSYVLTRFVKK